MSAGRGLKIELESRRRYSLVCFLVGIGSNSFSQSLVRIFIVCLRSILLSISDNFGVVAILMCVVDYRCCYCYVENHLLSDRCVWSNRNRNRRPRNVSWSVPAEEERLEVPLCGYIYCGGSCLEYGLRALMRRRAARESTTLKSCRNLFGNRSRLWLSLTALLFSYGISGARSNHSISIRLFFSAV